ncbi:MAG TPA: hypothetical protein VFY14_06735 [Streptomyces sp.]|nr:hypothetical protein [Streptomyces sp.]
MRCPRRPAHAPAASGPGWTHPYTGTLAALAVCHADGGDPPNPAPPAGDPAPAAPKPSPPPGVLTMTQDELTALAAREKAQGKRSALKEFAEEHGFTTVDDAKAFIAAARKAQDDALSEQEKREKALAEREAAAEAREKAAIARERAANRRAVLVGLGATGDDLEDAVALLRVADDADDTAVREAAEALKERRPELFGTARTPERPTPPPAPGGAPAGGPPARPPATKDDITERARQRAIAMGLRTDDAA